MWTALLLLNVGVLFHTVSTSPYVSPVSSSSPPSPTNVAYHSVNLRNVVRWLPGNGTTDDTRFTVQYAIYGDHNKGGNGRQGNWRPVWHCTDVARHWCDLTNETWDLENSFYARVRAVGRGAPSRWAVTRLRFDPKTDTILGPPAISVELDDNTAIITLRGPMRYQPNSQTPEVSMAELYPQMVYNIFRRNTHHEPMHRLLVTSPTYQFKFLEYDVEYCFSAQARFISMHIECQTSEWHCITTPQDPVIAQLQRMIVGIVVPSLAICVMVVIGYTLHRYLTVKGHKSPHSLNPPSLYVLPLAFHVEETKIALITEIKAKDATDSASDPAFPERRKPRPSDLPPAYSPQGPDPPLPPEEDGDDLSDYGAVCVCQSEERNDPGNDGSHARGERQAPSYLPQTSPRGHTQLRTHVEASARAQRPSGLIPGTPNQSQEVRDRLGIYLNRNPQTGLFEICVNQTGNEWEAEEVIEREDEGVGCEEQEERESQGVALLSAYARQNTPNSSHADPDYASDDYDALLVTESTCIKWDPETGKFLFPAMETAVSEEGGEGGGPATGERRGGEKDDKEARELNIDCVFVRQASEEQEAEGGEQTGWDANDFLSKWNLVVSTNQ